MKERPILFSGPMVRALLEGRKTQTRRVVRITHRTPGTALCLEPAIGTPDPKAAAELCPYGVPGDRLWVRETWQLVSEQSSVDPNACGSRPRNWDPDGNRQDGEACAVFAADGPLVPQREGWDTKWKPSIHMPRWASRLTLEITSVRVESLQEVSEADAKAEGLVTLTKDGGRTWKYGMADRDGLPGTDNDGWEWRDWSADPRAAYRRLWSDINGPDSWNANPWVWVVEFKVVTP